MTDESARGNETPDDAAGEGSPSSPEEHLVLVGQALREAAAFFEHRDMMTSHLHGESVRWSSVTVLLRKADTALAALAAAAAQAPLGSYARWLATPFPRPPFPLPDDCSGGLSPMSHGGGRQSGHKCAGCGSVKPPVFYPISYCPDCDERQPRAEQSGQLTTREVCLRVLRERMERCAEKIQERNDQHFDRDANYHRLAGIRDACADMIEMVNGRLDAARQSGQPTPRCFCGHGISAHKASGLEAHESACAHCSCAGYSAVQSGQGVAMVGAEVSSSAQRCATCGGTPDHHPNGLCERFTPAKQSGQRCYTDESGTILCGRENDSVVPAMAIIWGSRRATPEDCSRCRHIAPTLLRGPWSPQQEAGHGLVIVTRRGGVYVMPISAAKDLAGASDASLLEASDLVVSRDGRVLKNRHGQQAWGDTRCAVCGGPVYDRLEAGCVRGNCALRPSPKHEHWFDIKRAVREGHCGALDGLERLRANKPDPRTKDALAQGLIKRADPPGRARLVHLSTASGIPCCDTMEDGPIIADLSAGRHATCPDCTAKKRDEDIIGWAYTAWALQQPPVGGKQEEVVAFRAGAEWAWAKQSDECRCYTLAAFRTGCPIPEHAEKAERSPTATCAKSWCSADLPCAACAAEEHRRYHDTGMCYGDSHAEYLEREEAALARDKADEAKTRSDITTCGHAGCDRTFAGPKVPDDWSQAVDSRPPAPPRVFSLCPDHPLPPGGLIRFPTAAERKGPTCGESPTADGGTCPDLPGDHHVGPCELPLGHQPPCGPAAEGAWLPEWKAWRGVARHPDLAPVDAYYAGWRESRAAAESRACDVCGGTSAISMVVCDDCGIKAALRSPAKQSGQAVEMPGADALMAEDCRRAWLKRERDRGGSRPWLEGLDAKPRLLAKVALEAAYHDGWNARGAESDWPFKGGDPRDIPGDPDERLLASRAKMAAAEVSSPQDTGAPGRVDTESEARERSWKAAADVVGPDLGYVPGEHTRRLHDMGFGAGIAAAQAIATAGADSLDSRVVERLTKQGAEQPAYPHCPICGPLCICALNPPSREELQRLWKLDQEALVNARSEIVHLEAAIRNLTAASAATKHFLNDVQERFVLHLIDVVWQTSKESTAVPDWSWSRRMLTQAWQSFVPLPAKIEPGTPLLDPHGLCPADDDGNARPDGCPVEELPQFLYWTCPEHGHPDGHPPLCGHCQNEMVPGPTAPAATNPRPSIERFKVPHEHQAMLDSFDYEKDDAKTAALSRALAWYDIALRDALALDTLAAIATAGAKPCCDICKRRGRRADCAVCAKLQSGQGVESTGAVGFEPGDAPPLIRKHGHSSLPGDPAPLLTMGQSAVVLRFMLNALRCEGDRLGMVSDRLAPMLEAATHTLTALTMGWASAAPEPNPWRPVTEWDDLPSGVLLQLHHVSNEFWRQTMSDKRPNLASPTAWGSAEYRRLAQGWIDTYAAGIERLGRGTVAEGPKSPAAAGARAEVEAITCWIGEAHYLLDRAWRTLKGDGHHRHDDLIRKLRVHEHAPTPTVDSILALGATYRVGVRIDRVEHDTRDRWIEKARAMLLVASKRPQPAYGPDHSATWTQDLKNLVESAPSTDPTIRYRLTPPEVTVYDPLALIRSLDTTERRKLREEWDELEASEDDDVRIYPGRAASDPAVMAKVAEEAGNMRRPRRPGHRYVLLRRGPGPHTDFIELEDHEGHGLGCPPSAWLWEDDAAGKPLWVLEIPVEPTPPAAWSAVWYREKEHDVFRASREPTYDLGPSTWDRLLSELPSYPGAVMVIPEGDLCRAFVWDADLSPRKPSPAEIEQGLRSGPPYVAAPDPPAGFDAWWKPSAAPNLPREIARVAWEAGVESVHPKAAAGPRAATAAQKRMLYALLREKNLDALRDGAIDVEGLTVGEASVWIRLGTERRASGVLGFVRRITCASADCSANYTGSIEMPPKGWEAFNSHPSTGLVARGVVCPEHPLPRGGGVGISSKGLADKVRETSERIFDATIRGSSNWIRVSLPPNKAEAAARVKEFTESFGGPPTIVWPDLAVWETKGKPKRTYCSSADCSASYAGGIETPPKGWDAFCAHPSTGLVTSGVVCPEHPLPRGGGVSISSKGAAKPDEGDCPKSKDGSGHCRCWWDCDPCCWCGHEGGGKDCDCPKHIAMRKLAEGKVCASEPPKTNVAFRCQAPARAMTLVDAVRFLFGLLDDIDTLDDACKDDDAAFRKAARKRQRRRWETGIESNGYTLDLSGLGTTPEAAEARQGIRAKWAAPETEAGDWSETLEEDKAKLVTHRVGDLKARGWVFGGETLPDDAMVRVSTDAEGKHSCRLVKTKGAQVKLIDGSDVQVVVGDDGPALMSVKRPNAFWDWWEAQGLREGPGKSTSEAAWNAGVAWHATQESQPPKDAALGFEEWWGADKRADPHGLGRAMAQMGWEAGREALLKEQELQPTNLEVRAARWIGGARALLTRTPYEIDSHDAALREELLSTPWPEPEKDWDEEIEATEAAPNTAMLDTVRALVRPAEPGEEPAKDAAIFESCLSVRTAGATYIVPAGARPARNSGPVVLLRMADLVVGDDGQVLKHRMGLPSTDRPGITEAVTPKPGQEVLQTALSQTEVRAVAELETTAERSTWPQCDSCSEPIHPAEAVVEPGEGPDGEPGIYCQRCTKAPPLGEGGFLPMSDEQSAALAERREGVREREGVAEAWCPTCEAWREYEMRGRPPVEGVNPGPAAWCKGCEKQLPGAEPKDETE